MHTFWGSKSSLAALLLTLVGVIGAREREWTGSPGTKAVSGPPENLQSFCIVVVVIEQAEIPLYEVCIRHDSLTLHRARGVLEHRTNQKHRNSRNIDEIGRAHV